MIELIQVEFKGKPIGLATSHKKARQLIREHAASLEPPTYYVKVVSLDSDNSTKGE
jgi:hypothetical protein